MIGTLGLVFGYQYMSSRWFIIVEILLGTPLLLLILMPVLEAAKRLNFLNPYNQKGRAILSISVLLLCVYLIYSASQTWEEVPPYIKLSYLAYTLIIYAAFAIYTLRWDREKINTEWFSFESKS